ncbi:putative short-chain dehydrogenase/reductase family protein [Lasiosphaeris hirsuta]|uniref:Short-chain dehydrogenase/reductase family protein n=1 Tax=Lasiosphaeris hirsuta TaxID=260670 RepID=A0AA40A7H3_9PEZI|nr:putative short-chain dehydrogenase/reductase family protein [Lasiosphaeris hirsuta]
MSQNLSPQAAASEATFLGLIRRQLTKPKPLPAGINLTGQVAIVTGSNTGLGLESCRQLLALGLSQLVMGVRSQAKGDEAAAKLRKEFPLADATITVWVVDMESYDSVRDFTAKCATLPRINIAILNAGLAKLKYTTVSSTGHETVLQVNYLSTVLLAILLLPILKARKPAGTPAVLSIVGSDAMYSSPIKADKGVSVFSQFDVPDGYSSMAWYSRTKVLLAFFVYQLAQHVDPDDVIINVSNPGATGGTDIARLLPWILQKIVILIQYFVARPVGVGASVYLDAVFAEGKQSHGGFVSDWAIKPFPPLWYTDDGKDFSQRLWQETLQELEVTEATLKELKSYD